MKLEDIRIKIPAEQKGNLKELETFVLLNLSNIRYKNKDYTGLLNIAKEVTLNNPQSGKGFFRYAQALYHLGKPEAALNKVLLAEKYIQSEESSLE